jgi:hypothetical protein
MHTLTTVLGALFAIGVVVLLVLLDPTPRNIAALKFGGLALAIGAVCALLWPYQMALVLIAPFALLLVWGLFRFVFWPFYWVEGLLRR